MEYTESSSHISNKAYAVNWTYDFDGSHSIYLTGFSVEKNGDMGKQTGFSNDTKGIYYGVTYKLNRADSLDIVFMDQQFISSGQKNT